MATFTPNQSLLPGASPESEWAYLLGAVPYTDAIVFTKESLLDFLKTKGVHVSSTYKELAQLPKYATVGKFDRDPAQAAGGASSNTAAAAPANNEPKPTNIQPLPGVVDAAGNPYRPTYKVTQPMGGGSAQISALFAGGDDEEPPRRAPAPPLADAAVRRETAIVEVAPPPSAAPAPAPAAAATETQEEGQQRSASGSYRPTTKVTLPGGTGGSSSITLG